jgi:hypothetical protein
MMFGWSIFLKIEIYLKEVMGKSEFYGILSFFTAQIVFVGISKARYTTPYTPSCILLRR